VHHKKGRSTAATSHESRPVKPSFCIIGPSTEDSSSGGRTDNSDTQVLASSWDTILIPARDATQRRGATTTRQSAGLGARGVTKTTTGTRTSKLQDSDPPAHEQLTRRHNRCRPDGRKHEHITHQLDPRQAQPAATVGFYAPCTYTNTASST